MSTCYGRGSVNAKMSHFLYKTVDSRRLDTVIAFACELQRDMAFLGEPVPKKGEGNISV